jgi:hypothetical protein
MEKIQKAICAFFFNKCYENRKLNAIIAFIKLGVLCPVALNQTPAIIPALGFNIEKEKRP